MIIPGGYKDVRLKDKQEDIESLSSWELTDGAQVTQAELTCESGDAGWQLIEPPIKGASLLL